MEEKKLKHVAILGSTGSIGTQALEVIRANPQHFVVEVLVANSNSELLIKQAIEFKPNAVVIVDETKYKEVKDVLFSHDIKVYAGAKALEQIVDNCISLKIGARGLHTEIEKVLMPHMYNLKTYCKNEIKTININRGMVLHPKSLL